MASIAQRLQFAEKHWRSRKGQAFQITPERQWVLDDFWLAADGFKWWPKNPQKLCSDCGEKANTLTEWTWTNPTATSEHAATGCEGLELHPVICTILNLPRREGKTFNTSAYIGANLFQGKNKSILYVAAAGEQTKRIFRDNYVSNIDGDPILTRNAVVRDSAIKVPKNKSFMEIVTTAASSITGTGRTHVIIDEARDVPGNVLMAAIPSVFDENGLECPNGHIKGSMALYSKETNCPICTARLNPWYARIIITSSSALVDGTEDTAWFPDLVQHLLDKPDPNYHVFKMDVSQNPDVHAGTKSAVDRVFSEIPSLRDLVQVEVHNRTTRKGDKYLTRNQVNACVDKRLFNQEFSNERCVGFLDTSDVQDLTSLVVLEEANGTPEHPFENVRQVRLDVWDPKTQPTKAVDELAVLAHLDRYMPLFPQLILRVDTRLRPWARRLIHACSQRPWGLRVQAYNGNTSERVMAWSCLEARILARKIVLQDNATMLSEFDGIKAKRRSDGLVEVSDISRKRKHADILDALANACLMAHEQLVARVQTESLREYNTKLLSSPGRPRVAGLKPFQL